MEVGGARGMGWGAGARHGGVDGGVEGGSNEALRQDRREKCAGQCFGKDFFIAYKAYTTATTVKKQWVENIISFVEPKSYQAC